MDRYSCDGCAEYLLAVAYSTAGLSVASADIAAVDREGALLLKCTYKSQRGVQIKNYWFEQVSKHVQNRQVSPALQPYFARIAGAGVGLPG